MTDSQIQIARELFKNASKLQYGSVAVELKIHAGRYTAITYTISENVRQKEDTQKIQ